ncbi:Hypothetical predicted protein [Paramuricea clavata]|uniref:Uncharacterized protein n=1 Tax=Paramuricea clavata TaxID=317549 RepID=A0A7D9IXE8_PARCT|nr:Hypothetical predicted protein [Paramuricea clavata]
MNNQNYVFCSIYFPSTNSNLADFIDTLTCLNAVCTQLSYREEQIIIAGDFNVHVSDPRSGQRENNRRKLLLEMFAEFDMFPVNVDMLCMGPLFTYYSSCGNSVVDYIFASRNIERIVKCVKVGDEHLCNNLSYHLPLIASIEISAGINCHESSNNLENEYERIAWRKCASEQVLEYQRRLYDTIITMDDTLYISNDVENYYRLVCRSVKSSDKCLPRAKYKKSIKPYWNNELKRLKTACMELHKKWTSEGRPRGEQYESFRLYKDAKRLFRKEQRKMVRKTEENDFKELNEASEIDHIKFWKYVNRRRKKKRSTNVLTTNDGRTISNPEEIADVWANYYEKLLTPEENTNFDDDFREIPYITLKEIEDVLTVLPNNKAPGDDGITYEHIKYSADILAAKLLILYNKIIELEDIPRQFKLGIKIPIPKGGKSCASKFDDHRGITLLCTFNKVFERLVLNRLQNKIRCRPHPLQWAYQAERDALTTSFVIDESTKHCCEENDKVFACYVDVSKAFDKVWINGMLFKQEIMEKSIWHNLGKYWHTDVSSLIPILEAAKKGQAIGIGLANLGCRFNGMSPLVATKLWARIALPKMLYGAELWTLNREKLSKLEKVQNIFLRVCLGLLSGTSGSAARGLLGLWTVGAEIDKRKLLFLRRLICASENCVHRRVFMIRLNRWRWNPNKITGFVPELVRILQKYCLWEYMDNFLQSGNFPNKSEWKKTVIENINHTEIEFWKIKTQRYKQLGLYSQVVKEPMRNMWLQFALENSEMANQVAIIAKFFVGHSL